MSLRSSRVRAFAISMLGGRLPAQTLPSGAQLREARERDTGCRTRDQKLNQPINFERLLMQPANRGQIQVLRAIGDR